MADLLGHVRSGSGGNTALTDAAEGSVVRTLMEAFARELAVCYEQLDIVYQNAYIETASASGLDNVVALLGVARQKSGHLEGSVSFGRNSPAPDDIYIPQGTLVAGRNVPLFATSVEATLQRGEKQVSVGVRALEAGGEKVAAGTLSLMPRPLAGIESVSNDNDLILRQRAESDEALRQRSQQLMRHTNTGTVSALELAVRSLGIANVKVVEELELAPGVLQLVIGDADVDGDLLRRATRAAQEVRPAGVRLEVHLANRVVVQITATLELSSDLPAPEVAQIKAALLAGLQAYFASLRVGESVREAKVRAILTNHIAVVAVYIPKNSYLLNPHVASDEPGRPFKEARAKYALPNGDVVIGNTDRAALEPSALPVRLSFEPPKTKVWLDISASLKQGVPAVEIVKFQAAVSSIIGTWLVDAQAALAPGAALELDFSVLDKLLPDKLASMRVTVVHDNDGRALELDRAGARDSVSARELAQLRNVRIKA